MNLENIKVGMIVNNYKEMCKLLGEEVKTSNSKKITDKRMESLF